MCKKGWSPVGTFTWEIFCIVQDAYFYTIIKNHQSGS